MIRHWNTPWHDVPVCLVDCETTGKRPGIDRVVQVAAVRYERGERVSDFESLVNPGISIPPEATAVHGITDEDVASALDMSLIATRLESICSGAQLAAYNSDFDREMLPATIVDDPRWPWLDPLVLIRDVDRYAKGKARHTLSASCARHHIELIGAHGALADSRAALVLLFKLGMQVWRHETLGAVLHWTMRMRANQWLQYHEWLAKQQDNEES